MPSQSNLITTSGRKPEAVMIVKIITLILLACLFFERTTTVQGLNSEGIDVTKCTYQNTLSLGSTMTMYWNVLKNPDDASNHILEFGLICTMKGYCSIGFDHPVNQGMQSIDTLFAYTTNQVAYLKDCYCKNKHAIPTIDSNVGGTNDYLEINGGVVNGQYHYRWSRKMNTGDSQDATFKNSNVYVSWAYHSTATSISATHTDYGRNIQVNFLGKSPTETYAYGMIYNSSTPYQNDTSTDSVVTGVGHRYHLYALGIAVFYMIVLGLVCTYIPTSMKSNVATHFLLYRKVTKLVASNFPGVSYINMFLDFTVGELVIIMTHMALMVTWFSYGIVNQSNTYVASKVSSGFVQLIILNYMFLFIPVTRYSVLQALFGCSFERSIKYHKWLGLLISIFSTLHGIAEFIVNRDNIPYIFSVQADTFPLFGFIAWLSLGLLLLLSIEPIRRKVYELFLVFHIPLTIVTVTFSIIHGEGWINLLPYIAFSIMLMIIDLLLRVVIGFGIPTKLVQISYDEDSEVTTCVFEKRFLTFFHNPNHAHFVFVYIPQVSIYQLHPMTISSCIKLDNGKHQFTCHIKSMEGGGWSTKLATIAKSKKSISEYNGIRVEGAYGNLSIPFFGQQKDMKRTLVFIVAGIGATPCNAILTALEDPKYNDPTNPYKIFVNFTMRNEALLIQMPKILQQKPNVECSFFITGSKPTKPSSNAVVQSLELVENVKTNISIDLNNDRRIIRFKTKLCRVPREGKISSFAIQFLQLFELCFCICLWTINYDDMCPQCSIVLQ